jgi:hypothetical protein
MRRAIVLAYMSEKLRDKSWQVEIHVCNSNIFTKSGMWFAGSSPGLRLSLPKRIAHPPVSTDGQHEGGSSRVKATRYLLHDELHVGGVRYVVSPRSLHANCVSASRCAGSCAAVTRDAAATHQQ